MAEVYDFSNASYEVKMERLMEWLIAQEMERMEDFIPEEWEDQEGEENGKR